MIWYFYWCIIILTKNIFISYIYTYRNIKTPADNVFNFRHPNFFCRIATAIISAINMLLFIFILLYNVIFNLAFTLNRFCLLTRHLIWPKIVQNSAPTFGTQFLQQFSCQHIVTCFLETTKSPHDLPLQLLDLWYFNNAPSFNRFLVENRMSTLF